MEPKVECQKNSLPTLSGVSSSSKPMPKKQPSLTDGLPPEFVNKLTQIAEEWLTPPGKRLSGLLFWVIRRFFQKINQKT